MDDRLYLFASWPFTTGETVLLMTTFWTGCVSMTTVWLSRSIRSKVDIVHQHTNSRLSRLETELQSTKHELAKAVAALLVAQQAPGAPPPGRLPPAQEEDAACPSRA